MKTFYIRRALHSDASAIIDSHIRSIREVCSKDYTPEQIAAWSGRDFKIERWCETIDKDYVWVVEVDSKVRGFGHFSLKEGKVGEIRGLYFAPECRGLGAGKKLFKLIEDEAKRNDIVELQLNGTITAKPFYESCGFKQVGDACGLELGGVQIPCFFMNYFITDPK